uniref:Uncharacterized protein n=1 Tax=Arundo donax TaxID=35708 RepID=A0A0A9HNM1_ARUDO
MKVQWFSYCSICLCQRHLLTLKYHRSVI